jgi:hypothetical protein
MASGRLPGFYVDAGGEMSEGDLITALSVSPPFQSPVSPPQGDRVLTSSFSPSKAGSTGDWRKAFVQRSTGTSRKIEFLCGSGRPEIERVAGQAVAAMDRKVRPTLVEDGLGGTYFINDENGRSIAVFKPRDEEALAPNNPKAHAGARLGAPGMKAGVLVGEAALNEYATYLLDQWADPVLRAGVCATGIVRFAHSMFFSAEEDQGSVFRQVKDKVGSFQLFADHECTAEDYSYSRFSGDAVHRIAMLDIRLCNTDRHTGNILVKQQRHLDGDQLWLIPIDHGFALPAEVGDATFDWVCWPQAKQPFSDVMRDAILAIDPDRDEKALRFKLPAIREECLTTLRITTSLLKKGVQAGLTAFDIAGLMIRPYARQAELPAPSQLEEIFSQARSCALRTTYYMKQRPQAQNSEDVRRHLHTKAFLHTMEKLIQAKCLEMKSAKETAAVVPTIVRGVVPPPS